MATDLRYGLSGSSGAMFVVASADATAPSAAAEAIALIGGGIAAHVALADAADALVGAVGTPVVVLDLSGATHDLAHDSVETMVVQAAARGCALVIAMTVAQIDLVVGALDGGDAHLLCDPDQAEWIGTLAVAAAPRDGRVRAPDSEVERLAREMARIAEVMARLMQRDAGGGGKASEQPQRFAVAPAEIKVSAAMVRDVIRTRRLRDRFFGAGLFEDPAWDMLLDLFAARLEGAQVSVSSLCIAAAVAPTTALRWIGKLSTMGLLERAADPSDGRRAFMALSDAAVGAMGRYVGALRAAGLPLA